MEEITENTYCIYIKWCNTYLFIFLLYLYTYYAITYTLFIFMWENISGKHAHISIYITLKIVIFLHIKFTINLDS